MAGIVSYDQWQRDLAYQHPEKGIVTSGGKNDRQSYDNYVKTMQEASPQQF